MALRVLGSFRHEDIEEVSDAHGVSFTSSEVGCADQMDVMQDDDCGERKFILRNQDGGIICERRIPV